MTPTNAPLLYIQSCIAPTCFGVIYAILRRLCTEI